MLFSKDPSSLVSSNGSLSTTFDPGTGFDAPVYEIDRQLNDRIVAVGEFTSFSSSPRPGIVRLTLNGEIDNTFDVGTGPFEPTVNAIAALPSGRLLAGGEFASFDFQPQDCLVCLLGSLEGSNTRSAGALQPLTGNEVAGSFSLSLAPGNVFTAVLRQNQLTTTFRGAFDFAGRWTGFFRRPDGVEIAASLLLSRSSAGYGESLIFGNLISPEGGEQIVAFKPLVSSSGRHAPGLTGYFTAALAANEAAPPLGKVTSISRVGLKLIPFRFALGTRLNASHSSKNRLFMSKKSTGGRLITLKGHAAPRFLQPHRHSSRSPH